MSNLLRKLTGRGMTFAHLGGIPVHASHDLAPSASGKAKSRAEDEQDDENDPDDQTSGDGDSKGKKGKKASTAENDDESEEDPGNTENSKRGKKAVDENPEADDDDDEDEMRGKSAAASARRRERARCAAIMGSQAAGRNPVLAANLAFKTTMTRSEALAVLDETPGAAAAAPSSRRNPSLGAGGDRSPSSSQAIQASWDVAMQGARPKKR